MFSIEGVDATEIEQSYLENTNVLRTVFRADDGVFELIDFAPRFNLYDRFFKPSMLIRIMRPLSGEPRARVRCRPTYEYGLAGDRPLARVESHRVHRLPDARPPDDERAAHVRRGRAPVPARARPPSRPHLGRAARSRPRGDRRALPRAHARLLASLGEGHTRAARLPARGRALRARAEAPSVRGHGRAARRDDDEPPRAPRLRPQLGLPLLLAARRVLHAQRARAPRALGGDGELPRVPAQPLRGERRACSSPRTGSTATRKPRSGCSSTSPGSTATGRCASATRRSSTSRTTSTARWCSRSVASSSTRASSEACRSTRRWR